MKEHAMASAQQSGARQYVYNFDNMKKEALLGKTSTSEGSSFTGERIYCGLVTKKRGTGSKPHYHPDETFNYVLKGALKVNMDGQEFVVPTGSLLHIPPNMVHTAVATDDGDVTYLVWRDIVSEKEGKASTIEV
jgi:quercetin dioxygenase-like cupin family protein